jgi:uncharacterized membrane protein
LQNLTSKAYIILSLAGFGDAIYTATEYAFQSYSPVCAVNSYICCSCVGHSGYTGIFGIQFYDFGLIWFPLLFVLGALFSDLGRTRLTRVEILLPILMIGNLFTIYLWYLELFVIHAICPFCVSLYVVNYALTGLVIRSMYFTDDSEEVPEEEYSTPKVAQDLSS